MIGKIGKIISRIFWGFLTVGILLCPVLGILGFRPNIVLSGSMEPAVSTGSVCIINTGFGYPDIQEGDVIAFHQGDTQVMHRVVSITDQGIETKGDNNEYSDGITTTADNFIGKEVCSVPYLGYLLQAVLTPRGKILIFTLAITLLISSLFSSGVNKRKNQKQTKARNRKESL